MQNPQEYKKLRAQWYLKLKENGFDDIEDVNTDGQPLIDWHSYKWFSPKFSMLQIESNRDYYIMAEHFLNEHEFKSEFDLLVWILHSEGESCRTIAQELNSQKDKVNKTINQIKKTMRRGF